MRMYRIRVVTMSGKTLIEYAAITHPAVNECLTLDGKRYMVTLVEHLLKTTVDGNGTTVSLDEVVVEVLKR